MGSIWDSNHSLLNTTGVSPLCNYICMRPWVQGSPLFWFLVAKWKALCTFKALQSIEDRKEKCTTHSSTDDDPCPILTVQQFYNLYEALDFKWTPPAVCHNFTLALHLDAYMYICLSYLKKKENLLFWCLVVKDCWKDICKWYVIFFLVEWTCVWIQLPAIHVAKWIHTLVKHRLFKIALCKLTHCIYTEQSYRRSVIYPQLLQPWLL